MRRLRAGGALGAVGAALCGVLLVGCGGTTDGDGDDGGGGLPGDALVGGGDSVSGADAPGGSDTPGPGADGAGPDGTCTENDRRCGPLGEVQACVAGNWMPEETCTTGRVCRDGRCVITGDCTPGQVQGCANESAQRVCNEEGTAFESRPCDEGLYCVQGVCGDQLCAPGSTKCQDLDNVLHCSTDGRAWGEPSPCPEGTVCNDGACVSGCLAAIKLSSYIGCQYWTVDLDNFPDPYTNPMPFEVPHSVVISNPSHVAAIIQFHSEDGVTVIPNGTVLPGEAVAFQMPRQDVDGSGITWKSIFIESSMPVNAYQFNPFNNENVYSNDASLLLPANTLGRQYIVASWPSGMDFRTVTIPGMPNLPAQSGYVTIVATDGGTTSVTVRVSCDTDATQVADSEVAARVEAMTAGTEATFSLEQYQVLSIQAKGMNFANLFAPPNDLTGTTISATKPVAVFGGHEEAVISWNQENTGGGFTTDEGNGSCCADHLEEQLLPVQVWTNDVLCAHSPPRSFDGNPVEPDLWRIFSAANANQITTDPPIEGLDGITLQYAQWVEVQSRESFIVHGTGPVMAVQYVVSQEQTDQVIGDPATVVAVPVGQFREDYAILVPDNYGSDWVTVVRLAGDQVLVDGVPAAAGFAPIGSGDWEVGWVPLDPGVHDLQAAHPFGLIAFGWDSAVSYGYPAGLNLRAEDWAPAQ